jgi:hypothetical protein
LLRPTGSVPFVLIFHVSLFYKYEIAAEGPAGTAVNVIELGYKYQCGPYTGPVGNVDIEAGSAQGSGLLRPTGSVPFVLIFHVSLFYCSHMDLAQYLSLKHTIEGDTWDMKFYLTSRSLMSEALETTTCPLMRLLEVR